MHRRFLSYSWIQSCIGPASADNPSPEALVPNLRHLRVVGTGCTSSRERAVLVSIIAGMTVGDATAGNGITQWWLLGIRSAFEGSPKRENHCVPAWAVHNILTKHTVQPMTLMSGGRGYLKGRDKLDCVQGEVSRTIILLWCQGEASSILGDFLSKI